MAKSATSIEGREGQTSRKREPKPGFKRIFVELPDEQFTQLEEWATKHDRTGGANEAARVLLKRHFKTLIETTDQ